MNQYYQNRHERQIIRFEGLDLADMQQQEIIASAKTIPLDLVLQFNWTQFHITSQSHPGAFYSIDLNLITCDCQDFPKIQFCKYIVAIHLHFPYLCFQESDPIMLLENSLVPDWGKEDSNSNSRSEAGSESALESVLTLEEILQICTLMQEINSLS